MRTCARCGAELQEGAKFCVMCGAKAEPAPAPYATSTLTGAGLAVAISTAAICAALVAGVVVLVQGLLA